MRVFRAGHGWGAIRISMPSSPELSPRQTAWQLRIDQQDDETAAAIGVQPIYLPATGKSCRISCKLTGGDA